MKFDVYEVTITLTEPILGTVPKNPKTYANYLAIKAPDPKLGEKEVKTVPEVDKIEKPGWTGFHHDESGYFIYDYMVLGFLKEAGNVLKEQLMISNLRSKIDQYVFIEPRRIYLAKEIDDVLERPLRVMTMQGPRVMVVRSDMIKAGTSFIVSIRILENKANFKSKHPINGEIIRELLGYGKLKGLGQFRNGSYGRFVFEMRSK